MPPLDPVDKSGHRNQHDPERHRVNPQIRHEPQMVPGREQKAWAGTAELCTKRKIVPGIEIEKPGRIAEAFDDLLIGLRRHDHEHAENQRDQEPARPCAQEWPDPVFAEHESGCGPGDQKQQRQSPRVEHQHQGFQCYNPMGALDVELPGYVEHADMVEDQQPEGADPDPIEVDAPLRHAARNPANVIWFAAAWLGP